MVKLYNTLNRKKEELQTRDTGKVKMYVCGPTTYNYIHLGNARPIVVFDTVRRYLEYRGYDVMFIQNFTDVDDKIINKAKEEGVSAKELAEKYIGEYFKDADALGVKRANYHPKVTEHIDDIISMIEGIIENGFGYEVDGEVYFDVRSFPGYGKLSQRSIDDMRAGARVEVDKRKKDPLDFVLWKPAKPNEPSWDSPWGEGRPGWHIECSAMSLKYLSNGFDIHGGGFDLIFPHHENEIAQTEASTKEEPFVRYWMHNGFITVNQEKMSKSLGNFFLVREILEKFPPDVVRYYLLATHYRSPLDFDDTKLDMNAKALEKLKNTRARLQELMAQAISVEDTPLEGVHLKMIEEIDKARNKFEEAMDDDFNTALAIAGLFEISKELNNYINQRDFFLDKQQTKVVAAGSRLFEDIGANVLGIFGLETDSDKGNNLEESLIQLLIDVRQKARGKKDWAMADYIRDQLAEYGVILEDTPKGCRWKKG